MILKIKNNMLPLCFLPSGMLICYRLGKFLLLRDGVVVNKYDVFRGVRERFLGGFNIISRLLRIGVRAAIPLNEDRIVFYINGFIYEYCFSEKKLSAGYKLPKGIRPLIFTEVEGLEGFTDGIIFGGYLGNPMKRPVPIYRRVGIDNWEVVYTFAQGEINHVHNIVVDKYRKCLWVFTGDFDEASAIWKVTDNFSEIKRMLSGDQRYRSCVVFPVKQGLLYATDTPFVDNYIYMLDTDTMQSKIIREIPGSCIYGCKWKNKYVFSTTVEPDGRGQSVKGLLFNRKRGAGIKDNFVHLYSGTCEDGFVEIYKEKKDCYPYIFQFGVFKFPYGDNEQGELYFQPVATQKNDLKLMILK